MSTSSAPTGFLETFGAVWSAYNAKTPKRVKVIDAYLMYVLITGIVQFVYMLLVASFPFNSFLAAFLSCVAVFVLTVSLRMQVNPTSRNKVDNCWTHVTPARAYADWLLCNLILHTAVLNFIG